MFFKKVLLLTLLISFAVFLIHFFHKPEALTQHVSGNSLRIVTSFSILKDFVEKITAGNKNIHLESIVPVNADPHTYQTTPQASKTLAAADLIFINGLDFERNIEKLILSAGFKGKVYKVTEGILHRQEPLDPHLWHDVNKAKGYILNILKALCQANPQNQNLYQRNVESLLKKLERLDQWIKHCLQAIPVIERQVVTTHDAFWYFGHAYDVHFLAPVGISTEIEASAKTVAHLIQMIKDHHIKAVFVENLANPKQLQIIAVETGIEIKGSLYADSLSDTQGEAASYETMMIYNTRTICEALVEGYQCPNFS